MRTLAKPHLPANAPAGLDAQPVRLERRAELAKTGMGSMPSEPKTKPTNADVAAFIASSPKPEDGAVLCAMMGKVSGAEPQMWGPTMVGFGSRTYALAGGRQGQMLAIGFAPRRSALVLYLPHAPGWDERLVRLGRHSTGKGCLYVPKLAGVDVDVLEELIAAACAHSQRQ